MCFKGKNSNIRSKKEIANTWKSFYPIGLDGTLSRLELNSSIQQESVIFEETNRRRAQYNNVRLLAIVQFL